MAATECNIVAVVDDDDAVRASITLLLELAGHCVETFASAAEFFKADVRRFACLLLDHYMPHMTGLDLAAHLRAEGIAIPIVLMTGLPSRAIATQAAKLDIERVFVKPLIADDMLAFVSAVLDQ